VGAEVQEEKEMIKVQYVISCDWCGVSCVQSWELAIPRQYHVPQIPFPELPSDWQIFNGSVVCNIHSVVVETLE
jgi:hypothetical protein